MVAGDFEPFSKDLFDQLVVTTTQKPYAKVEVNAIERPCVIKQSIARKFRELITRIDISKHRTVNSKFNRNYRVIHQKGRKVSMHLRLKVKIELAKLLNEGHIEKLSNCFDKFFIFSIAITVKKDQSIKIALDSKTINKIIYKNK